ncbi:MAG: Nitrogen regulation protein NR(II) [Alphaproteobacteria bacterium MarineAlpha3_Bin5]|nr:two-component sensor histidine kinase [Magnetovibrio sp.]PPR78647.1 MAG: Nitrogen regulation protein NR(II) [Alphaproteobacteria bacterium MarineAlpha3_Bin5]
MVCKASNVSKLEKKSLINAQLILNAIETIILVVDNKKHIVFVNPATENFFQTSAHSLIGQPLDSVISLDSPIFALMNRALKDQGSVSEFELILENSRIKAQLVSVQICPLPEISGTTVLSFQRRSMAEKIERQLIHRDASKSLSAMSSIIAHEIKNPLSSIRGAAQLLEEDATPQGRNLTKIIKDETDRICGLLDDIGLFNTNTSLKRDAINIHLILDHVQQLAKHSFAKNIKFINDFDPSLPPIHGHHDQLVQVFLNLVKNAVEATPKKRGEIFIKSLYQPGMHLTAPQSATRNPRQLEVSIQDAGKGIAQSLRNTLFDPFVTSKSRGSGLGLSIAAKIIDDHGGIIECDSLETGTIFRVMLPFYENKK